MCTINNNDSQINFDLRSERKGPKRGDVYRVDLGPIPGEDDERDPLLRGARPCMILFSTMNCHTIIPFTKQEDYNIFGISIQLTSIKSYPRFDMVQTVSDKAILEPYYGNIIYSHGFDSFKMIIDTYHKILSGEIEFESLYRTNNLERKEKEELAVITEDDVEDAKERMIQLLESYNKRGCMTGRGFTEFSGKYREISDLIRSYYNPEEQHKSSLFKIPTLGYEALRERMRSDGFGYIVTKATIGQYYVVKDTEPNYLVSEKNKSVKAEKGKEIKRGKLAKLEEEYGEKFIYDTVNELSIREAANTLGIGHSSISTLRKKYGIEKYKRGER